MRSLKARQQNAPSVEETRAVETLAAFFRLVMFSTYKCFVAKLSSMNGP